MSDISDVEQDICDNDDRSEKSMTYIPCLLGTVRWQHETQWERCSATFWKGDNSHCGKRLRRVVKSQSQTQSQSQRQSRSRGQSQGQGQSPSQSPVEVEVQVDVKVQ